MIWEKYNIHHLHFIQRKVIFGEAVAALERHAAETVRLHRRGAILSVDPEHTRPQKALKHIYIYIYYIYMNQFLCAGQNLDTAERAAAAHDC